MTDALNRAQRCRDLAEEGNVYARSAFERHPAGVRDANALNLDRHAAGRTLGPSHHCREPGEDEAGEHLGREAVHYDEHFHADTARDVGQRLVEGTVRDSDASEIREA